MIDAREIESFTTCLSFNTAIIVLSVIFNSDVYKMGGHEKWELVT